jgi:hypothetical protein
MTSLIIQTKTKENQNKPKQKKKRPKVKKKEKIFFVSKDSAQGMIIDVSIREARY